MTIEYMTGVGSLGAYYHACGPRETEFLELAAAWNKISVEDVREQIATGKKVQFDRGDAGPYYLRDAEMAAGLQRAADAEFNASKRGELRCRKCGQTGHSGAYPFSTLPGSGRCDDCC